MIRTRTPPLFADMAWPGDDGPPPGRVRPEPAGLVIKGYVVDPADLPALESLLGARPTPGAPAAG